MAEKSLETLFAEFVAQQTEVNDRMQEDITDLGTKAKEHDDLMKTPWWKPLLFSLGFLGLVAGIGVAIGSTPSRAEFEGRKATSDAEFTRIWTRVGDLSNQTARTETEIKNIHQTLNKMDSKMDVLLMQRK